MQRAFAGVGGTRLDLACVTNDSINDVTAARAAGSPILCVPYGYNEGEPVDNLDFDGMINGLYDACDWIERRTAANTSTPTQ